MKIRRTKDELALRALRKAIDWALKQNAEARRWQAKAMRLELDLKAAKAELGWADAQPGSSEPPPPFGDRAIASPTAGIVAVHHTAEFSLSCFRDGCSELALTDRAFGGHHYCAAHLAACERTLD